MLSFRQDLGCFNIESLQKKLLKLLTLRISMGKQTVTVVANDWKRSVTYSNVYTHNSRLMETDIVRPLEQCH